MKLLLYTFIFSVVVIVGVSLIPEKKSGEAADSGDNSESVAENTEKKSARTAKGEKNAIPYAPSIPAVEVKFKENTLGQRLHELSQTTDFYFGIEENGITTNSFIPSKYDIKSIKNSVVKYAHTLQTARELAKYSELGIIKESITTIVALSYTRTFLNAMLPLLVSARVQLAEDNFAAAEKEFELAAKLLHTFAEGTFFVMDLFIINRCLLEYYQIVTSAKLSEAQKKKLLSKLPDREKLSKVLPKILKQEQTNFINYVLNHSYYTGLGISETEFQELKKYPEQKLHKIFDKAARELIDHFAAGTLTKNTRINVGTELENKIFNQTFSRIVGIISENTDKIFGKKDQ